MMRRTIDRLFALSLLALGACGDPVGPNDANGDAIDAVALDVAGDSTVPIDGADHDATDATDTVTNDVVATDTPIQDVVDATSSDTGTDVVSSDAMCLPITNDTSAIDRDCSGGGDCPTGYTCRSMSGVVLQQRCEVICQASCECPSGLVCTPQADKAGTWMQCAAP